MKLEWRHGAAPKAGSRLRRRPFEVLQAKENERFILEKGTEDGKEKGKAGEAETDRE